MVLVMAPKEKKHGSINRMETHESLNLAFASRTLISRFHLDVDATTGRYDLLVELVETEQLANPLSVCFYDVAELKLEALIGGWIQFMMLRVTCSTDISRERRMEVRDREHETIQ